MATKRILITGGTGFAGSHLVEYLSKVEPDAELHLTALNKTADLPSENLDKHQIHEIDLADQVATHALFSEVMPDRIYHLAALAEVGSSFTNVARTLTINTQLQLSVLSALHEVTPESRLLLIGSAQEYGMVEQSENPVDENQPFRPINPYAVSKVAQDLLGYAYAQSYKLPIIRVRPFNHTGERQTTAFAIPAFAKQIVAIERDQQQVLKVGNLAAIRDISDVKDIVRGYQLLLEKGEVGQVYNIGSGVGVSMQAIVDELRALASCEVPLEIDQERMRPIDVPELVADISVVSKLGWQPDIPRVETLQRILIFWRNQT